MTNDFLSNLTKDLQNQTTSNSNNPAASSLNLDKNLISNLNNLTQGITKNFTEASKSVKSYVSELGKELNFENKLNKIQVKNLQDLIKFSKEQMRVTSQKITNEKNIRGFSNFEKYVNQIHQIDELMQIDNMSKKDVSNTKRVTINDIKNDNNKIGFDIATQIEKLYKGSLSLTDILSTAGSAINKYVEDAKEGATEANVTHVDFIKGIYEKIEKGNIGEELMKESVEKKIEKTNTEIAQMEQRADLWKKEDVVRYASLLKQKDMNDTLEQLTNQSFLRLEKEKKLTQGIEDLSSDYARALSEKIIGPLRNLPIIGDRIGDELAESLEKSLMPKFKKAFSAMLFKHGSPEEGLSITKVGTLLSSLGTAVVATAGLVLVIGGAVAAGYALYKVFDSIIGKANELDKVATDIAKNLGAGYTQGYKLAKTIKESFVDLSAYGVTLEALSENMKELYSFDFDTVTKGNLLMLSKLTQGYEIAGSEGAKIIIGFEKIFGYSENKMDRFFSELQGQANIAGIGFKGIVEDIAGSMDEIVLSGGKNVKNIVAATIKARQMGNSLSSITKVRDSFVDLPDAMEKSAQLSLITGQRIDGFNLFYKAQMGGFEGLQDVLLENMRIFEKSRGKFEDSSFAVKKMWEQVTGLSNEELSKMFTFSRKTAEEIAVITNETKDWENALSNTQELWDKIKDLAKGVYLQSIMPMVTDLQEMIKGIKDSMTPNILKNITDSAKNLGKLFGTAWESVKKIFKIDISGISFWEKLKGTIDGIGNILKDFFETKFDGIKTKFESILEDIKFVGDYIMDAFSDPNKSVWQNIKDGIGSTIEGLSGPIAVALRKAIFKTSPTLATVLGISGADIQRENSIMDWENSSNNPQQKAELFDQAHQELNDLKAFKKQKGSLNPFEQNDPEKLKKFQSLQQKYEITSGTEFYKIEKLEEVLESKLRTLEDYEKNYQKSVVGSNENNFDYMQGLVKQYPEKLEENQKNQYLSNQVNMTEMQELLKQNQNKFRFNDGGKVTGAGTETSDSIFARLSAGEFVLNAKAAKKYQPILEAMNKNKFASGTPSSGKEDIFNQIYFVLTEIKNNLKKGLGVGDDKTYLWKISDYFNSQLKSFRNKQINEYSIAKIEERVGTLGQETDGLEKGRAKLERGGMLNGPSHVQGGISAMIGGKKPVELEGGEVIINKRSMKHPGLRKLASMINKVGGGVDFSPSGKFSKGGFIEFANDLAQKESTGNQKAVNKYGYMGLYQFGKSTLKTLGINTTKDNFLNDKSLQDEALKRNIDYHIGPKDRFGFSKYFGSDQYGISITPSGIYGATHLKGAGGAKKLLKGKDSTDAFGTKASDYLKRFNDYDLSNIGISSINGQNNIASKTVRSKIKSKNNSSIFSMIPMFEDGGEIGTTSRIPQYGDQGNIKFDTSKLVHDAEHLGAHVGAEKVIHKVGGKIIGTTLAKMLAFSGNLLDPTSVSAGTKTPEMIAEELESMKSYGPEKMIGPELPPKRKRKKKFEEGGMIDEYSGSKIEPIAKSSLMGIANLFKGRVSSQVNVEDENVKVSGDYLNRIGGNETNPEQTWKGVKGNVKNMWARIANKFGGAYITDAMRHGSVKRGSGGQHQEGLAIDIGAPHAQGATATNPAPRGTLDNVANYIADRFQIRKPGEDWSGITKGHQKGQLIWRSSEGGNHYNHVHASLKPEAQFKDGGYLRAYDGMEAHIDSPTLMTLGNKKIITGDNASGKETVSIQPKENRDRELALNERMVSLMEELVYISKNKKSSINLDGKTIMKNTINHLINDLVE